MRLILTSSSLRISVLHSKRRPALSTLIFLPRIAFDIIMLGKRSRFRRTGSCVSELGSKLSFPSTECTREKQSPRAQPDCSADFGPNVSLLQSVHSLGAPPADVGKEAATDASFYKIETLQNGPELMCFEGAFLEDQGQCLRNNVREGNWNSSMLVPLAVGRVDPQEALLECSETQTALARDSQLTEWHRNTRTSISLGVSTSSRGPHTFQTVPSFLDACFLCKKRLGPRVDIFMYRGDAAFCSDECREHQMSIDERREQAALSTDKMARGAASPVHHSNHSGGVVPTDTAAAVAYVGLV